jgi:hypothetical protein
MAFSINPNVDRVLDPPTNETRGWVARREFNADLPVIDAAQAVPSYPPAEALQAHLAEQVKLADTAFYTPILGIAALREALAESINGQYEADVAADHIAITCGGNHAYCMAISALAGPGDEVVLPEPFYFNHQMWFDLQSIGTRLLPCRETADGLVPDLDELRAMIGERTRAVVLVTPNNPTGTIYAPHYLDELYTVAQGHGIALVLDETYKDFLPGGQPPHRLFSDPDWGDTLVFLYSFSKVYSLTGYRVGALAGGGRFIEAIAKIADTLTICAPHVSQKAALFGLRHLVEWTGDKRGQLNSRLAHLRRCFEHRDSAFKLISSGAFFGYVRHPFEGTASLDVSRKLFREQSVLTWPGSFFGPNQENYVRLAFANAGDAEIEELVRRLADGF